MTAEIVLGRKFGDRTGYVPLEKERTFNAARARLDAHYLENNADELNIVLRYVAQASEELSVQVAVIRELPPAERRRSNATHPLHDLCTELFKARSQFQEFATSYAKLVVEIEERIEDAQRYIIERNENKGRQGWQTSST